MNGYQLQVFGIQICIALHCASAPSLFVAVSEVKMSRQMTLGRFGFKKSISHRNSVMETKVPDFVSTMSRTIKCNHCSKLFVNQQGLSVHEKCVHGVFTDVSTHKIISILFKISSSALFLKYSSNFANFGLDILIKYILIKKRVYF